MNGINALHTKQAGIVFFREKTLIGPSLCIENFSGSITEQAGVVDCQKPKVHSQTHENRHCTSNKLSSG
jgi:hypothetical protein